MNSSLEAIRYVPGKLLLLDQLQLPFSEVYLDCSSPELGFDAIRSMKVRGAPAIALAAALSVAAKVHNVRLEFKNGKELGLQTQVWLRYLNSARPTAVNLMEATSKLCLFCEKWITAIEAEAAGSSALFSADFQRVCIELLEQDVQDNKAIGRAGAAHLIRTLHSAKMAILTHCNTGSLATAGYGTALGVIRSLHASQNLAHAYCTETRPYNQGARLTAFELVYERIPATLVTDSMVSYLMSLGKVNAVIVGADRVARNGDTANKIGTYQLAVAAKHHNIPFFVAAPFTSVDLALDSGAGIEIEQRPAQEMTHIQGVPLAAPGIDVWNPGFDVTPGQLITGFFTEKGAVIAGQQGQIGFDLSAPKFEV
jgi:methylthioribose-1-phosphate isomerase